MNPRDELLRAVRQGLERGVISASDLQRLVSPVVHDDQHQAQSSLQIKSNRQNAEGLKKLSVIDVLFYVAGIILYAALMVLVGQSGDSTSVDSIVISLGTGLLIWTIVFVLGRQSNQSEVRRGLINALLLTGSLAVTTGGVITATHIAGTTDPSEAYYVFGALLVMGLAHLAFDMLMRHTILIIFGVMLLVASFPTIFVAILGNVQTSADIWAAIAIATSALMGYGGRLASRTLSERHYFAAAFASLAVFIGMGAIYVASLAGSAPILWQILLPLTIYSAFFISIKRRNKNFLFTGSLFLIVFLITISFKYFSGAGVAVSLVLAGISILGTAFMALNINKRYIKQA